MANSIKEQVAAALLTKIKQVKTLKSVTREQPTYDGIRSMPSTAIPGATLVESDFTTQHIRPTGPFAEVAEKRTTVAHQVTIYLLGDPTPEKTLNNLSAEIVAKIEADQSLGLSAEIRIVEVSVTGGNRLNTEVMAAQNLNVTVTYIHPKDTL